MAISIRMIAAGAAAIALALGPGAALAAPAQATAALNVRSGPGTGYPIVNTLQPGEGVDVRRCQGNWCYVVASGPDGWASSRYLTAGSAVGNVPPPPPPVYVEPQYGYDNYDNYDNYGYDNYDYYYNNAPVYLPPPVYVTPPSFGFYFNGNNFDHRRPDYRRRSSGGAGDHRPPPNRAPQMGSQPPSAVTPAPSNNPPRFQPQLNMAQPRFQGGNNPQRMFRGSNDNRGAQINRPHAGGQGGANFCQLNPAICQARHGGDGHRNH